MRDQSIIAPDILMLRVLATLIGMTALAVIAIITHARVRINTAENSAEAA